MLYKGLPIFWCLYGFCTIFSSGTLLNSGSVTMEGECLFSVDVVQICCGITHGMLNQLGACISRIQFSKGKISAFCLRKYFKVILLIFSTVKIECQSRNDFTLYLYSCKSSHLKLFVMTLMYALVDI